MLGVPQCKTCLLIAPSQQVFLQSADKQSEYLLVVLLPPLVRSLFPDWLHQTLRVGWWSGQTIGIAREDQPSESASTAADEEGRGLMVKYDLIGV